MTVLIVSNAGDATADYLCGHITDARIPALRLNTEELTQSADIEASSTEVRLRTRERSIAATDVTAVWYRRPKAVQAPAGQLDDAERAFAANEWTAALEGFLDCVPRARWMNHPAAIMGASSKIEQLRRSRQRGLDVPEWICTRSRAAAVSFLLSHGDVVAKPLASGYLERCEPSADTLIYTNRVLPTDVSADVPDLGAPTLFQKRCFGIDVRVTIVDEDVRAMELERTDGVIDVRRNNMRGVSYRTVHLPSELRTQLIRLVRSYQLRFAAIDMIRDSSDQWWFLELNPNGQWAWLDLEADANIFKAFIHAFAQWRA